jgi:hypothetical protein
MPAAFVIMHISRGNSAVGSVTRRAPTPDMTKVPVMKRCALVVSKVHCRLTTFSFLRPSLDLRDGNPVSEVTTGR